MDRHDGGERRSELDPGSGGRSPLKVGLIAGGVRPFTSGLARTRGFNTGRLVIGRITQITLRRPTNANGIPE